MHTNSLTIRLLQRRGIFSALFAALCAANATAQSIPFANISSRSQGVAGQNVLVVGFIITSTATTTKQVVIRGLGPSTGVPGYLADPTLTLNGPDGVIYSNNNWRETQEAAIAATGLQPSNDLESAITWILSPGNYTVTLNGYNGGTGVGAIEVYDTAGPAPIVNLSSRAQVGTGDNVLIGGTFVRDSTRAVIRAIGPSLTQYGIQGALQDPALELHDAYGTLIAANDNWVSDPQAAEIQQLGLAPGNSNESAMLATLTSGSYTAIVKGVNDTTGVGMVELYALADASYPRIFQAWSDADNLNEDRTITVARHDLMWNVEYGFGWNWVDNNFVDTQDYHSESIVQDGTSVPYPIPTLRSLNHNIKILCAVDHFEAAPNALPPGDPWWKRDGNGNRILAPSGSTYLLNQDDPSLRTHVARRAAALMQTGQFDGIMLDECFPNTSYLLALVTEVRNAIGPNALIIVNANDNKLNTSELGQINGVFMESGAVTSSTQWQNVKAALDWNEFYTRTPRVNCLESSYINSRNDLNLMRATTCLSLTHSNGFALFSDPNSLPTLDHLHNWYDPFWSNHNLGVPIGSWYTTSGYAHRRDFKNGSAIWNASGNPTVTVTFPEMRTSQATGQRATSFVLPGNDGGIYTY